MARFKDQRKGGTAYDVRVSDGKYGQSVGTYRVVARTVKDAKREGVFEAIRANVVIDESSLYAHGPTKAG